MRQGGTEEEKRMDKNGERKKARRDVLLTEKGRSKSVSRGVKRMKECANKHSFTHLAGF